MEVFATTGVDIMAWEATGLPLRHLPEDSVLADWASSSTSLFAFAKVFIAGLVGWAVRQSGVCARTCVDGFSREGEGSEEGEHEEEQNQAEGEGGWHSTMSGRLLIVP